MLCTFVLELYKPVIIFYNNALRCVMLYYVMFCFVYYVKQRYVMFYRVMLCYITIIRYIKSNSNVGMLLHCPRLQKLRLNIVKHFSLKK